MDELNKANTRKTSIRRSSLWPDFKVASKTGCHCWSSMTSEYPLPTNNSSSTRKSCCNVESTFGLATKQSEVAKDGSSEDHSLGSTSCSDWAKENRPVAFGFTDVFDGKINPNVQSLSARVKYSIWEYFKRTPTQVFSGKHINDLPNKKIRGISDADALGFSFPEDGLITVHKRILYRKLEEKKDASQIPISNKIKWKDRENYAYGMLVSLYEQDKVSDRTIGEPIADCLCALIKENCCVLALADGVSWGEKAKLAATCSVYSSITHLIEKLDVNVKNTRSVFRCILQGFEKAQQCIVDQDGAMTTLCVAVVVELVDKPNWGLCVVNLGDTYAYVYSEKAGVREVTAGSHSLDIARDMRISGGALGPADGYNPDVSNLTCSFTLLEEGDIVYVCSDGISDNFDPIVSHLPLSPNVELPLTDQNNVSRTTNAFIIENTSHDLPGTNPVGCVPEIKLPSLAQTVPESTFEIMEQSKEPSRQLSGQYSLTPAQRQQGALGQMTTVIRSVGEDPIAGNKRTAIDVCAQLLNFVVNKTAEKRKLLEEVPQTIVNQLSVRARRQHVQELKQKLEGVPGKLDHASIVAYQVGRHIVNPLKWEPLKRDQCPSTEVGVPIVRALNLKPAPRSHSVDSLNQGTALMDMPSQTTAQNGAWPADSRQFFSHK